MIENTNNKQFWLINTISWIVYFVIGGLFYSYIQGYISINSVYIQLIGLILILLCSYYLRRLIQAKQLINQPFKLKTISLLLLVTLIIALSVKFIVSLFMLYCMHMMTWETYSVKILAASSLQLWIALIGWSLIYFIVKIIQGNRKVVIEKFQLQAALKEAELLSLKSQLNPHFIFNCLNNIRAIAIDDGEKTRKMLTHLAEILKINFKFNQQELINLEQEIDYIHNYLLLESIQLEQRLVYSINNDAPLEHWKIPPMSIQLLVENAIKHGIMLLENGGTIDIKIYQKNNDLIIDVINDGKLTNTTQTGIGLSNLRKRIELLLNKGSCITLSQIEPHKVRARMLVKQNGEK